MTIASGTDWDSLMNQVRSQLLPLLVPVFMGHQRVFDWFNHCVEKLLQQTAAGQDSALFRGITVDPVVLTYPDPNLAAPQGFTQKSSKRRH